MEEKGYRYEYDIIAVNNGISVPPYNILSPEGNSLVGLDRDEAGLERYLADYETTAGDEGIQDGPNIRSRQISLYM